MQLVEQIPGVWEYGFSFLRPKAVLVPHHHTADRVSLLLSLQGQACGAYSWVDGQTRRFVDGEFLGLDYRRSHSAYNPGPLDRVVLTSKLCSRDGAELQTKVLRHTYRANETGASLTAKEARLYHNAARVQVRRPKAGLWNDWRVTPTNATHLN